VLTIRRARAADAAPLSDLAMRSKAIWGYDEAFMEACREELATTVESILGNEIWLAAKGEAAAGFYELIAGPDGHGEIRMCFVAPGFLRQGIGGRLWAHLERRARFHGIDRLGLDADPNAVPFYQAMGMAIVGEAPSGSIAGRMLPRMAKAL